MGTEPWRAGGYQSLAASAGPMDSTPAVAGAEHTAGGPFSGPGVAEPGPAPANFPGMPEAGSTEQQAAAFMPRSQRAGVLQQGMTWTAAWAQ